MLAIRVVPIVFWAVLVAGGVRSQSAEVEAPRFLALRSASRLWIEGQSTIRSWSCDAHGAHMELTLEAAPTGTGLGLLDGKLVVPVLGLECGNGSLNKSLRAALAATAHPDIHFQVTSASLLAVNAEGEQGVLVRGELSVAGVTRLLEIPVRDVTTSERDMRVRGSTKLDMTDFGIEPPTWFRGLIKARNDVMIGFDLVLAQTDVKRYRRGEL